MEIGETAGGVLLLSLAKQLAFMTISRTEVAGSSKISTSVAPRNVSLISLGCIWANDSDDWLYNADVIRSADFKPSSVDGKRQNTDFTNLISCQSKPVVE